ncbi:methyl-accepting chemotaxis protein [Schinkia azotoformans]|uniref:methyl-accepting chemotaxis protein n=1 Tax=Schinkia azotoformans TaxID=1454 RepID=UPI002DB68D75|nr:methyl-accepting chemotaxis protein [Schinkia azotoformans]MEC1716933.1 methyl-accepting chemotaxis protein [Schinkia azotoformans]MEC1743215.1 methyl-accepting chemotaxis protein [Schinkia azotoformans]MEC1767073.1 methyl-accepting chemotaxis protein [Schinkia azotoformans]MEC1786661.1 methyl-accepting chemotaxis protein [Schinkia azotoformans]MED4374255.1 methyl-accepting chemotaxis protein [Schinkia azotoformans]
MQCFFAPGTWLINKFKYSGKFFILGVIVLIPLVLLSYFLFSEINNSIEAAEEAVDGAKYNNELKTFLQYMQQHRGTANGYLNGDQSFKEKLIEIQKKIDDTITTIDNIDQEVGNRLKTTKAWTDIKNKWVGVSKNVYNMKAPESFALHTEITYETMELIKDVADSSKLKVVPQLDASYLMESVVNELPLLTENMGQARGKGAGAAAKGVLTDEEKLQFSSFISSIRSNSDNFIRAYSIILNENPEVGNKLKEKVDFSQQSISEFLDIFENRIIKKVDIESGQFFDIGTKAIDASFALYEIETNMLNQLLLDQVSQLEMKKLTLTIIVSVLFLLAAYLCISFFMSVKDAVTNLVKTTSEMANGNLTVRTKIKSEDELLVIGEAFNGMADSFSMMIKKSQEAVEQLASSSEQLSASADETEQTAMQIADTINGVAAGATKQSDHTGAILEMIKNTKAQVDIGNAKVEQSFIQAKESSRFASVGNAAISEAISHLGDVTRTVQFATDSIQKLGKRSNEIGGIISVITNIADQTNLLALNAAIEAARAGEQGKGFAVVAEEVRKLAEQSSTAARQIIELIESIQSETSVTVRTMESNLTAVQGQVNIIQKGGESLKEIVRNVEKTEMSVQELQQVLVQLEENADEVLKSVQVVAAVIEDTAASAEEVAASAEEQSATVEEMSASSLALAKLAEELQSEINRFTV